MFARRAWKSVNVLHDETSSHCPTPGAQTSRSYVFALAKPVSPAASSFTRYGSPSRCEHRLGVTVSSSSSASALSGVAVAHQLDLVELVHAQQAARVLPRAPASRRKHGV